MMGAMISMLPVGSNTLTAIFFLFAGLLQQGQTNRCSYQNPDAWHAPECRLKWVVNDPHRTTSVRIEHSPAYHTYSIWGIENHDYVLAYRDKDSDPSSIVVDFYRREGGQYLPVGTEDLGAVPNDVRLVRLLPNSPPQIAFIAPCGQLQCLSVVKVDYAQTEELFDYAASEIRIHEGNQPFIEAVSRTVKVTEKFAWDPKTRRFSSGSRSSAKD
jgi:hypothetical protein